MDIPMIQNDWQKISNVLVGIVPNMILIGVYSMDTYLPISFSFTVDPLLNKVDEDPKDDLDKVQAEDLAKISIAIEPKHVKAIIRTIRNPQQGLTRICITTMNFLCMGSKQGTMTAMSNFNMENTSYRRIDDLLFGLTGKHFTRSNSFMAFHALQLSALIHDNVLVIGMCEAGEESSLSTIKALVNIKEGTLCLHDYVRKYSGSDISTGSPSSSQVNLANLSPIAKGSFSLGGKAGIQGATNAEVEMRPKSVYGDDFRREGSRRVTSFCEDWRSSKSFKTLTMIASLGNGTHDDRHPLIDGSSTPSTPTDQVDTAPIPQPRRKSRTTDV